MAFSFSDKNLGIAKEIVARYPADRSKSAVMPLLDLAQTQNDNYLSDEAVSYIAEYLDLPFAKVEEVATFYSMFNRKPVGKYHIQLCGTTPCMLMGSENIKKICLNYLELSSLGETTPDNLFTITEVECLGACSTGPVVQINNSYYENLTEESFLKVISELKSEQ